MLVLKKYESKTIIYDQYEKYQKPLSIYNISVVYCRGRFNQKFHKKTITTNILLYVYKTSDISYSFTV